MVIRKWWSMKIKTCLIQISQKNLETLTTSGGTEWDLTSNQPEHILIFHKNKCAAKTIHEMCFSCLSGQLMNTLSGVDNQWVYRITPRQKQTQTHFGHNNRVLTEGGGWGYSYCYLLSQWSTKRPLNQQHFSRWASVWTKCPQSYRINTTDSQFVPQKLRIREHFNAPPSWKSL